MARECEVCSSLPAETLPKGRRRARLRNVLIESRVLVLCDAHAAELIGTDIESIEGLRQHFRENEGRRSLITRRAPLDRRMFPPRPEGRRAACGRRTDDR